MKRKVLVWLTCIFVFSIVRTAVQTSGITLGGLPTALLAVALVFAPAPLICRALDRRGRVHDAEPVDRWYTCPKCGQLVREGEVCDCEAVRSALQQEQEPTEPKRRSAAWPLACAVLLVFACALGYGVFALRADVNDLAETNRKLENENTALDATLRDLDARNRELHAEIEAASTPEIGAVSYEEWKRLYDVGAVDAGYEEYTTAMQQKGLGVKERAALRVEWGQLYNAGLTALSFDEWMEAQK